MPSDVLQTVLLLLPFLLLGMLLVLQIVRSLGCHPDGALGDVLGALFPLQPVRVL